MPEVTLSLEDIDARISFLDDDAIMDVSFDGLRFNTAADVSTFYDRLEERIADTGETLWFFLVNYDNTWIDTAAWFAFSQRGRELNLAHSMGSVRYDATEITRKQIERDAGTSNFDPNLFSDRDSAIARLRSLPSKRLKKIPQPPSFTKAELAKRIRFFADDSIMDVDFSRMSFEHTRDVDDVYEHIEDVIAETGTKWFFLVNYDGTRIQSPAWVQYAARGKRLNENWSLGSVRYAPGSETETDIRLRAESGGFRPNIRNTRAEALERIEEMKQDAQETQSA